MATHYALNVKSATTTLCGRPLDKVEYTNDPYETTCKTCRTLEKIVNAPETRVENPNEPQSCPVKSRRGLDCEEQGEHQVHTAWDPSEKVRQNWLTPKTQPSSTVDVSDAELATTAKVEQRNTSGYGQHQLRLEQLVKSLPLALAAEDTTLARLDTVTSIIEEAERMRTALVALARSNGASWTEIGQNVGTSKQAAAQRYGKAEAQNRKLADVEAGQTSLIDALGGVL